MNDIIPDDLAAFILEKIESVAQLEALLLLRAAPKEDWTVDEVARRLYIDNRQAAEILGRLAAEGLLNKQNDSPLAFRYHPNSSELVEMVDRLTAFYAKHLVPVSNLIHSKPKSRIQEFSDAFKLRKKEE